MEQHLYKLKDIVDSNRLNYESIISLVEHLIAENKNSEAQLHLSQERINALEDELSKLRIVSSELTLQCNKAAYSACREFIETVDMNVKFSSCEMERELFEKQELIDEYANKLKICEETINDIRRDKVMLQNVLDEMQKKLETDGQVRISNCIKELHESHLTLVQQQSYEENYNFRITSFESQIYECHELFNDAVNQKIDVLQALFEERSNHMLQELLLESKRAVERYI